VECEADEFFGLAGSGGAVGPVVDPASDSVARDVPEVVEGGEAESADDDERRDDHVDTPLESSGDEAVGVGREAGVAKGADGEECAFKQALAGGCVGQIGPAAEVDDDGADELGEERCDDDEAEEVADVGDADLVGLDDFADT